MKFFIPFLVAGVSASSLDLLASRQDVGTVGEASCAEIGKSLAIENVTVNFAEVSRSGIIGKNWC